MNMIVKSLAIASASALFVACSSGGGIALECTWPDAPKEAAPGWICDEPVEGLAISAVGSAEMSAAGVAFTKNKAAADARRQLALQIGVEVAAIFKEYIGTTGLAGQNETVDSAVEDVKELFTKQQLTDTRIYKSITSPGNSLYVLVGYDEETKMSQVNSSIEKAAADSSFDNDNAAWQQFRAKQGHDYLNERMSE